MSRRVMIATFTREDALVGALKGCDDNGLDVLDVRSPYPLHGIDELAGIGPSRLPAACLIGGIIGLSIALWFQQWSSSVDWPIDVGGKPWNSLPAFAPVAFETTVLLAGLSVVFGLLGVIVYQACKGRDDIDVRITDDRFVLIVTRRDARLSDAAMTAFWQRHNAESTRQVLEETS